MLRAPRDAVSRFWFLDGTFPYLGVTNIALKWYWVLFHTLPSPAAQLVRNNDHEQDSDPITVEVGKIWGPDILTLDFRG